MPYWTLLSEGGTLGAVGWLAIPVWNKKIYLIATAKCPHLFLVMYKVISWWFQPIWNILVKLENFLKVRGENKKIETTT